MQTRSFLPVEKQLPNSLGLIHFIGIGGIGMSSIAEILLEKGFSVQGSDPNKTYVTDHLEERGIKVLFEQSTTNITDDVALVVRSTAIKESNPELKAARDKSIPVIHRSDMLAELMRGNIAIGVAGTHGKTTTTALVASVIDAADLDPTVINGGIIHAYKSNARIGKSDYVIAEADESDGSFTKLPSTIGIITNIEPEHLDHYGSFEDQIKAFESFINRLPFYGFAVICKDNEVSASFLEKGIERRLLSYSIISDADIKAENIRKHQTHTIFDIRLSDAVTDGGQVIKDVQLNVPGLYNVENALAAVGVAVGLQLPESAIRKGFEQYRGVKRRFTKTGESNGITVIDDYAHHPTEISTVLSAAADILADKEGKVIAVFQPHRYTRVHDLFEEFCTCFSKADLVIVTDIYTAGENPIDGISQDSLVEGISKHVSVPVLKLASHEQLPELIRSEAVSGDMVLCMGAGTISSWAYDLPKKLATEAHSI